MGRSGERWAEIEQDADLTTVGGRIEYARRRQELTQEQLSKRMPAGRRKSRASIALYENGSPVSLEVIEDLASALNEDPAFLAFGKEEGLASAPQGQRVPIIRMGLDPDQAPAAVVPRHMLADLDVKDANLELVRLAVDAPTFGVQARDYLLIDAGHSTIEGDGRLYAVDTSAGVALVRSEPLFSRDPAEQIQLTGGQGVSYSVTATKLDVLGRLVASLRRHG